MAKKTTTRKTAKKKGAKKRAVKKTAAKQEGSLLEKRLFALEGHVESIARRLTPQLGSSFGEILQEIVGDFDDTRVSGKCDRCGKAVNDEGKCRNRDCQRYKSHNTIKRYV